MIVCAHACVQLYHLIAVISLFGHSFHEVVPELNLVVFLKPGGHVYLIWKPDSYVLILKFMVKKKKKKNIGRAHV